MLVIGHRGAAGHRPENTLASLRHALALGVDAVEIDVRRVDDALIVLHDDTVEHTTSGRGRYQAPVDGVFVDHPDRVLAALGRSPA